MPDMKNRLRAKATAGAELWEPERMDLGPSTTVAAEEVPTTDHEISPARDRDHHAELPCSYPLVVSQSSQQLLLRSLKDGCV
jgi:hypothetical protein